jgi:cold shock CspA family protein
MSIQMSSNNTGVDSQLATIIIDKLITDRGFGLGHSQGHEPASIFFHFSEEANGHEDVFSMLEEGDRITGEIIQGPEGPRLQRWSVAQVAS